MIPREVIVEMVQFIALTLHTGPLNLDKLPDVVAVSPPAMAQILCAPVPQERQQGCMSRAASISSAYVRKDNKIYYNAFIIHPETQGGLGKSYILHELVHWKQNVDFDGLTCSELKEKEIEAYQVQDAYLFEAGIQSNFASRFSDKFICRDKN